MLKMVVFGWLDLNSLLLTAPVPGHHLASVDCLFPGEMVQVSLLVCEPSHSGLCPEHFESYKTQVL